MLDVIKEYLVKLGFDVDMKGYDDMMGMVDGLGGKLENFAKSALTRFTTTGFEAITAIVGITAAIGNFTRSLANADINNQIFARQMWTTNQNAWALNETLKVMGRNLNDLYLSPELMHNFQMLRAQGLQMQAPSGFEDEMKAIRDVQFQFQRLKLEGQYALQWIGYYLGKYLGGPLTNIRLELSRLNDAITKQMPVWTKYIAQVLSWFIQLGEDVVTAVETIWKTFKGISDKIPESAKVVGGAIAGVLLLMNAGPVVQFGAAMAAMLLGFDDFMTHLRGGETALGGFWDWLDKVQRKMADTSAYKTLKGDIIDITKGITGAFDAIGKNVSLQKFLEYLKSIGESLGSSLGLILDIVGQVIKLLGLGDALKALGQLIGALLEPVLYIVTFVLRTLKQVLTIIDDLLKGDFKGAFSALVQNYAKDMPQLGDGSGSSNPSNYWNPSPSSPPKAGNPNPNKPAYLQYSPVTNVYGSDPTATANAVKRNQDDFYIRNVRGAIM